MIRTYNNMSLAEKVKVKRYYRNIRRSFDALNVISSCVQEFEDSIVWEMEIKSLK